MVMLRLLLCFLLTVALLWVSGGAKGPVVILAGVILMVTGVVLLRLLELLSQDVVVCRVQHESKYACSVGHGLTHQSLLLQQLI